jgi:hypothetical protein
VFDVGCFGVIEKRGFFICELMFKRVLKAVEVGIVVDLESCARVGSRGLEDFPVSFEMGEALVKVVTEGR